MSTRAALQNVNKKNPFPAGTARWELVERSGLEDRIVIASPAGERASGRPYKLIAEKGEYLGDLRLVSEIDGVKRWRVEPRKHVSGPLHDDKGVTGERALELLRSELQLAKDAVAARSPKKRLLGSRRATPGPQNTAGQTVLPDMSAPSVPSCDSLAELANKGGYGYALDTRVSRGNSYVVAFEGRRIGQVQRNTGGRGWTASIAELNLTEAEGKELAVRWSTPQEAVNRLAEIHRGKATARSVDARDNAFIAQAKAARSVEHPFG